MGPALSPWDFPPGTAPAGQGQPGAGQPLGKDLGAGEVPPQGDAPGASTDLASGHETPPGALGAHRKLKQSD